MTHLPTNQLSDDPLPDPSDETVTVSVKYILPFSGITMEGSIRPGDPPRAGFSLGLGHLLQYLMGLGSVMDTLIDPMDRIARLMDFSPPDGEVPIRERGD